MTSLETGGTVSEVGHSGECMARSAQRILRRPREPGSAYPYASRQDESGGPLPYGPARQDLSDARVPSCAELLKREALRPEISRIYLICEGRSAGPSIAEWQRARAHPRY